MQCRTLMQIYVYFSDNGPRKCYFLFALPRQPPAYDLKPCHCPAYTHAMLTALKRRVFHTLSHISDLKKVRLAHQFQQVDAPGNVLWNKKNTPLNCKEALFGVQRRLLYCANNASLPCKQRLFADKSKAFCTETSLVCMPNHPIHNSILLHTVQQGEQSPLAHNTLTAARAILQKSEQTITCE